MMLGETKEFYVLRDSITGHFFPDWRAVGFWHMTPDLLDAICTTREEIEERQRYILQVHIVNKHTAPLLEILRVEITAKQL